MLIDSTTITKKCHSGAMWCFVMEQIPL